MDHEVVRSLLYGIAVGDAFGVPYEFQRREDLKGIISKEMIGHGTHNQAPGTWSDDTSLTLCLADALVPQLDVSRFVHNAVAWYQQGKFAIDSKVFDIGIGTQRALERIIRGENPLNAGAKDERSNGNGSLMRVGPLVLSVRDDPVEQRKSKAFLSSLPTHGHLRSQLACWYFVEILRNLIRGRQKKSAIEEAYHLVEGSLHESEEWEQWAHFEGCRSTILQKREEALQSSGYVIHSLESALYAFLSTDDYKDSIILATSLGDDTDTVAAITGAMSGLFYGYQAIPSSWISALRGKNLLDTCIANLLSRSASQN